MIGTSSGHHQGSTRDIISIDMVDQNAASPYHISKLIECLGRLLGSWARVHRNNAGFRGRLDDLLLLL